MRYRFGRVQLLALAVGLLLAGARASAGPLDYHVSIDTSGMAGTPGSLEFQFASNPLLENPGSASVLNLATDGSVQSSPYVWSGSATGGLPGPLVVSENPIQIADVGQDFTYGHSLQFDVHLSEAGAFSLILWDTTQNIGNNLQPSADVSANGAALVITLDTNGNVTFSEGPGVSAAQIPEPSSLALFGVVVVGWVGRRWWRRRT